MAAGGDPATAGNHAAEWGLGALHSSIAISLALPVAEQLRRWGEAMDRGDYEPCPEEADGVYDPARYIEPDIGGRPGRQRPALRAAGAGPGGHYDPGAVGNDVRPFF
jgi:hypothetical protein